jgi:hypothetical protein
MLHLLMLASEEVRQSGRKDGAMRRYAVEFIGTFFLVLTIGCT